MGASRSTTTPVNKIRRLWIERYSTMAEASLTR